MRASTDDRLTETDRRTIADFGRQWTVHTDNSGYYGSLDMLADLLQPLLPVNEIAGARIADIGSGTGRIVNMLLDAGAASVIAVEPSDAVHVLEENTRDRRDRVTILHASGDRLPPGEDLDLVVSIGVLHHVVDPAPIVRAAFGTLRPGGRMLVWLYGREGNEAYLAVFGALRILTRRLPDRVLSRLCAGLNRVLDLYIVLCRRLPLPLRDYVLNVLSKVDRAKRHLIIYDQLNPAYARYYRRDEAVALLEAAGFEDVRVHHRHGYSWTVIGRKPG